MDEFIPQIEEFIPQWEKDLIQIGREQFASELIEKINSLFRYDGTCLLSKEFIKQLIEDTLKA